MKYTIKKGNHFANWWWIRWMWSLHYGDVIRYKVIFHDNCAYKHDKPQWDKSFGVSIGLHPTKHSVRFVHQYMEHDFGGWFDVTSYTHINGKHNGAEMDWHKIKSIQLKKEYELAIRKYNNGGKTKLYYFIGGNLLFEEQTEIPYSKWGWKLYPHVGGLERAKQDSTIELISY